MKLNLLIYLKLILIPLVGALGCVYPSPPIEWEKWKHTFPEHSSIPIETKIQKIEEHLVSRHLSPEGLLIYRRYDEPFDAENPRSYGNLADVPIWSGALLAAVSFKYAQTHAPEDLKLVHRVLDGLALLDDVTGKPGLLARSCAPTQEPFEHEQARHEARAGAPPYEKYRYRGDVSKDQYFGVLFGYSVLITAIDPEWKEFQELKQRAAPYVKSIADHIWSNDLCITDIDGEVTTFGELSGYMFGIPIGPNASLSLLSQKVAYAYTGEEEYQDRYLTLVKEKYPEATWLNKFQIFGRTNHSNDVMATMGLYSLKHLEDDDRLIAIYQKSYRRLWKLVLHEGNLFFNGAYHAICSEPFPEAVRDDLKYSLELFPDDLKMVEVDWREHPKITPGLFNERKGKLRNTHALPLHMRKISSFIWKSSPFAVLGNEGEKGGRTVSGVDFLLAYWLFRHHGLIPSPNLK